jgi:hypothetical protein
MSDLWHIAKYVVVGDNVDDMVSYCGVDTLSKAYEYSNDFIADSLFRFNQVLADFPEDQACGACLLLHMTDD